MKGARNLIFVFLWLLSPVCFSDILIEYARITDIRVGPWNSDSFAVRTTGTGDVCSGQWVLFVRSNMASPEAYDRAYTLALAAISSGKLVVIIGPGIDCALADTIGFAD